MPQYYDVQALKDYIRAKAPQYGINPDVALAVWTKEGLSPNVWQSNVYKNGKREQSFGPFQFYMEGGLGNEFQASTGLDPRDPKNVYAMADYAMKTASQVGWSPWYAARDNGISRWAGISRNGNQDVNIVPTSGMPTLVSNPPALGPIGPQNINNPSTPPVPDSNITATFVDPMNGGTPPSDVQSGTATFLESRGLPKGLVNMLFPSNKTGGSSQSPAQKGLLAHLAPYYVKNPSQAYLAQHLEDGSYPSLRSWLG